MNKKIADSYLLHIALAVRAGDPNIPLYRTMIDSWFCYDKGPPHLGSGGRPRWLNAPEPWRDVVGGVHELDYVSDAAEAILKRSDDDRDALKIEFSTDKFVKDSKVRLVVDHAVPVSALALRLRREKADTPKKVLSFLNRWYRRGLLTRAENALVNERLKTVMPQDTWQTPFDRYHAVGIKGKVRNP